MATTNVYALLPQNISAVGKKLELNDWEWTHCLSIPCNKFNELHLSLKPHKWLRYSIGAIVGARGTLSWSQDSLDPVDVDAPALSDETISLYYHINEDEKKRTLPHDPGFEHTEKTSSAATVRRGTFWDDVLERDGRRCVVSNTDELLGRSTHLVTHSKGDEYIELLTRHRMRDEDDYIDSIDDVRNGLYLNAILGVLLGRELAFMITPNFAMDTTDIDPSASPTERRCTSHLFDQTEHELPDDLVQMLIRPGCTVRLSGSVHDPPDIIFDAVYASAVVHQYGTEIFTKKMKIALEELLRPAAEWAARDKEEREEEGYCPMRHGFKPSAVLLYAYEKEDLSESCQMSAEHAQEEQAEHQQKQVSEKINMWLDHRGDSIGDMDL